MTLRKVVRWMLLIILVAVASGVGYGYWWFNRSDELLLEMIRGAIAEKAPPWRDRINIERVHYDWRRRIHLYDIAVRGAADEPPLVSIPHAVITVDREKFADHQQVDIQKILLVDPQVNLARDQAGRWNVEKLPSLPEPDPNLTLPDLELQNALATIRLFQNEDRPPAAISLKNANAQFVSSGKRRYAVKGMTQLQDAGTLSVTGDWNVDEKTWSLTGKILDVAAGGGLLSLAAGCSAELRDRLRTLDAALRELAAGDPSTPPARPDIDPAANLGLSATVDVNFSLECPQGAAEPRFRFDFDVKNGQVTNPALPFPLRELTGKINWDNRRLTIHRLTAQYGVTSAVVDGTLVRQGEITPGRFHLTVRNLDLNQRLKFRLPEILQKQFTSLRPAGHVDLEGTLHFDGRDKWTPHDFVMQARGCSIRHEKFPYRLQEIIGRIVQVDNVLDFHLVGRAGLRPVHIDGKITNPGPHADARFVFNVEQLPLDEELFAACNEKTRKVLKELKLQGAADVWYRYVRLPDPGREPKLEIYIRLRNCSMRYEKFPYPLTNLNGLVAHSSVDGSWVFRELTGENGKAKISATGEFWDFGGFQRLEISDLTATGATFDDELEKALPKALQRLWNDFKPAGRLTVSGARLRWIPGRPVEVTLPKITVSGASFVMRTFPLPIKDVRADFSYKQLRSSGIDRVEIHSFSGRHDETEIRASGFTEVTPEGDWRVRLTELTAADLAPDLQFRLALPEDLRYVFNEMNPQEPVSLEGMLEFRGKSDPRFPVTAAWDLKTVLSGNTLTTGVDLKQAHGTVNMWGTWDGYRAQMLGTVNLDSVHIWNHQLTNVRGPFRLSDRSLVIGSERAFTRSTPGANRPAIPLKERITAEAIGGLVILDSQVAFNEKPEYVVKLALNRGRLEQYARRYLPGQDSLAGIMTGELTLSGRGSSAETITGYGGLQITQAALYELPVMLQIFNALKFTPPDGSAFTYAAFDFNIGGSRFRFNRIILDGETISFYGRGTAGFNGNLNLDFYSQLPANRRLPIPLVEPVFREMTKGWYGISVTGKVSHPQARSRPLPQVDDALKQIFGAFDQRRPSIGPRFPLRPAQPRTPDQRNR